MWEQTNKRKKYITMKGTFQRSCFHQGWSRPGLPVTSSSKELRGVVRAHCRMQLREKTELLVCKTKALSDIPWQNCAVEEGCFCQELWGFVAYPKSQLWPEGSEQGLLCLCDSLCKGTISLEVYFSLFSPTGLILLCHLQGSFGNQGIVLSSKRFRGGTKL